MGESRAHLVDLTETSQPAVVTWTFDYRQLPMWGPGVDLELGRWETPGYHSLQLHKQGGGGW